jgi:hypothetical protein
MLWVYEGLTNYLGEILAARIAEYEPAWLDDQCLAGRIAWARLKPRNGRPNGGERGAAPVRTTPITLLPRRHAPLWTSLAPITGAAQPSGRAQTVADCIREHGASFFDELVEGTDVVDPTTGLTKKIHFLQSIPVDPFTEDTEWGKRSYQDDWDSTSWGRENVWDVYSLSPAKALDGTWYKDW